MSRRFPTRFLTAYLLLFPVCLLAEVDQVSVRLPESTAWTGQRVDFHIELRAPGSFVGTANFELPQLPGTLIMKVGTPVLSSEEIGGESWFVQSHKFALFSQNTGVLEVPAIPVTFSHHEGFTGPTTEASGQSPVISINIRRPPGSDDIGFLITAGSLDVSETWDPAPGPAQVGDTYKRTIVQRADDMTGMALAPAPDTAPDGIRVYPGSAETNDQLSRGAFVGERRETLTYLLQKPGAFTLPALTYVWWDPQSETLQSKTLPAAVFEVAPAPAPTATPASATHPVRHLWPWGIAGILFICLGLSQRHRIAATMRRCNPPDRAAARSVLHACRANDPARAATAWNAWRNTQPADLILSAELFHAVVKMQRQQFGPNPDRRWQGEALARALREHIASTKPSLHEKHTSALPSMNPKNS